MADKLLILAMVGVSSSLLVAACGSGGGMPGNPMSPGPDGGIALDAAPSSDAVVEGAVDTGWRRVYAATTDMLLLDADADPQMGRYFVVGQNKAILVGRGEQWTPISIGSLLDSYSMPRGMFQRVWVGPGHVFVIGSLGFYAGGVVEIGNGSPTIAFGDGVPGSEAGSVFFGGPMSAMSGTASDVWVGGSLSFAHFDGTTWTMSADDFYANAFATDATGVLWAAAHGAVRRREGNQWQLEVTTGPDENAENVWIAGDGTIFAVGYAGPFDKMEARIWMRRAGAWSKLSAGAELPDGVGRLSGVWGTSSGDVFVAGDRGALLHFDGVSWQRESIDTVQSLSDVSGMGSEVIVIGQDGIWQRNR